MRRIVYGVWKMEGTHAIAIRYARQLFSFHPKKKKKKKKRWIKTWMKKFYRKWIFYEILLIMKLLSNNVHLQIHNVGNTPFLLSKTRKNRFRKMNFLHKVLRKMMENGHESIFEMKFLQIHNVERNGVKFHNATSPLLLLSKIRKNVDFRKKFYRKM